MWTRTQLVALAATLDRSARLALLDHPRTEFFVWVDDEGFVPMPFLSF